MQNNNIRKTIPEPLMFIHTVSTPVITNGSKTVFDSRYKKTIGIVKKQDDNVIDGLVLKKLESIIKMNSLQHSVNCLFETTNGLSIEGIPLRIEDEFVIIFQSETEEKIQLNEIKDIIILKL